MSDITKIREWDESDENPGHWPEPPHHIESEITGDLRARILRKIGYALGTTHQVTIVETCTEGGYSEFTPETDYSVTVRVGDADAATPVRFEYSQEKAMTDFLRWVES